MQSRRDLPPIEAMPPSVLASRRNPEEPIWPPPPLSAQPKRRGICKDGPPTQEEIRRLDGEFIEKKFRVGKAYKWYTGKIAHVPNAIAEPYVFKITYEDGATETECYEGFYDRPYYRFPLKDLTTAQAPAVLPVPAPSSSAEAQPAPREPIARRRRAPTAQQESSAASMQMQWPIVPDQVPVPAAAPPTAVCPTINPKAFKGNYVSLGFFGYEMKDSTTRQRHAALRCAIAATSREHVLARLQYLLSVNHKYQELLLEDNSYVSTSPSTQEDVRMSSSSSSSSSDSGEKLEVERIIGKLRDKYLVIWKGYQGSATWEPVAYINKRVPELVSKFVESQKPVAVKRNRSGAPSAPVYSEDLEFIALATKAKQILGDAGINKITAVIEKYHTNTSKIKEYVFLLETVLNYYANDPSSFSHSVKWSNELGISAGLFKIVDDFDKFTDTDSSIFDNMTNNKQNAASIKRFHKKYMLPETINLHMRNYITECRFSAIKPNMMPKDALEETTRIVSAAHHNIFDEETLANISIRTLKYAPGGDCMCYLCGKRIDAGARTYKAYGELDHIVPKTISFIMNVIDTPLNYAPTHGGCNNHKKETLPPFIGNPINKSYIQLMKDAVAAIDTFKTLADCDPEIIKLVKETIDLYRKVTVNADKLGYSTKYEEARLASLAAYPVTKAALAAIAAEQTGGAFSSAAQLRLAVAMRRRPTLRLAVSQRAPLGYQAFARQPALSPKNVASKLSEVLKGLLSKEMMTPRDVMQCMLLGDLVDFFGYISSADRPRSQSGGAPPDPDHTKYFKGFDGFVTMNEGDPFLPIPDRREFMLFRCRMLYRFSLATYFNSVHATYVSRRIATDDQPAYVDYLVGRIAGCVDYILAYNGDDAIFKS